MKPPDAIAPLQTFEAAGRIMFVDADTFDNKELLQQLSPIAPEDMPSDGAGADSAVASSAHVTPEAAAASVEEGASSDKRPQAEAVVASSASTAGAQSKAGSPAGQHTSRTESSSSNVV